MSRTELIRVSKTLKKRLDAIRPLIFGGGDEDSKSYEDIIYYLLDHCLGTRIVFYNKFDELIKIAKVIDEGGDPEHAYLLNLFKTCYDKSGKSRKATRELNASLLEWLSGRKIDIIDDEEPPPIQPPVKSVPGKQPQSSEANKDAGSN
jgi:hypothetical protein